MQNGNMPTLRSSTEHSFIMPRAYKEIFKQSSFKFHQMDEKLLIVQLIVNMLFYVFSRGSTLIRACSVCFHNKIWLGECLGVTCNLHRGLMIFWSENSGGIMIDR